MKKITIWLCVFAMLISVFALASCGSTNPSEHGTTKTPSGENTTQTPGGDPPIDESGTTDASNPGGTTNPIPDHTLTKMPIGLTFGEEKGNERYYRPSAKATGLYEYVAEKDAIRVDYSDEVWTTSRGGYYAFQPKFQEEREDLTDEYKFVRVWYSVKNPTGVDAVTFSIINNAGGTNLQWGNVTDTNGFALSEMQVNGDATLIQRFARGDHCTFAFLCDLEGAEYYIRAVFFFDNALDAMVFTEEDAERYMSERPDRNQPEVKPAVASAIMTFAGPDANGKALESSAENGTWVLDDETNAVKLTRNSADTTSAYATAGYGYRAFLQFNTQGVVWNGVAGSVGDRNEQGQLKDGFVRVLYKLTLPAGTDSVDLALLQDDNKNMKIEWKGLTATNGFVLSATAEFPVSQAHIGRFMRCEKEAFAIASTVEGIEMEIKGVYFFTSPDDADRYEYVDVPKYIALTFGESGTAGTGTGVYDNTNVTYLDNGYNLDPDSILKVQFASADDLPSKYRGSFRIMYSIHNDTSGSFTLTLKKLNGDVIKTYTLTNTNGAFALTEAFAGDAELYDLLCGEGILLCYTRDKGSSTVRIKGIYFFKSEAEASVFEVPEVSESMRVMTFEEGGNGKYRPRSGGAWTLPAEGVENPSTASGTGVQTAFVKNGESSAAHKYVRVLYSITGATASDNSFKAWASNNGNIKYTISGLSQTDGFVLTDTIDISNVGAGSMLSRYYVGDCAVCFDYTGEGTLTIKAIYLFTTQEEADAFTLS